MPDSSFHSNHQQRNLNNPKRVHYNPDVHHRRSIRLTGYDYAQTGWYFITICTQNRKHLFGNIVDGVLVLNELGQGVETEWLKTTIIRPNIVLDEFIVMPNHIHGIINVVDNHTGGAYCNTPLRGTPHHLSHPIQNTHLQPYPPLRSPSQNIGAIIRGFKSATTKWINETCQTPGISIWQRNYYDRIIRNEQALHRIRQYIKNNPMKWESDDLF